jgi:predicted nucleic acid-binding protein
MLVVADTTPINYLVLIGQIHLLASLYTYCISRRNFFGGKQLRTL